MSALVTDQFRILNANNFVDSIEADGNSYYVQVGLPNPVGTTFGRDQTWNTYPPAPTDNLAYQKHVGDVSMFGKRITKTNVRRLIRRIDWVAGTRYEIYRHDYSVSNPSPISNSSRLFDANFYVMNSDYRVYVCIDNGGSGARGTANFKGNVSQDQPTFTDLEPSRAGDSGDGYIWKYLFTVSPSDIIKFDSTDYITVPNDWLTTRDSQIRAVREAGDSTVNENQIKKIYIEDGGGNYANGLNQELPIIGDGSGGKVRVNVVNGVITDCTVTSGGKGYSYAMVDLGSINSNTTGSPAKLIPIIPPSRGHGYNIYSEMGTDKVLVYARFDGADDFPTKTIFSQVAIVKNPTAVGTANTYTDPTFSSLNSFKFSIQPGGVTGQPKVGERIIQNLANGSKAIGYVASWEDETKVLKYFQDRSLYFNSTTKDTTDYPGISTEGRNYSFESSSNQVTGETSGFTGSIDQNFAGITTNPVGNKLYNLGVNYVQGLSVPEINKGSGEIIYLDNRASIARNPRQKEDIKIILEF